jgi:hypothetical protein
MDQFQDIVVHEKALGHLTRGLYRSPASAVRELVSNAWDANATEVRIETAPPSFQRLSVVDNGDGFTKDAFVRLMNGFGNSDKRTAHVALRHGRPTIGRLGIGLLGIAQVCNSFEIRSRPRKGEGFVARIELGERLRSNLDANNPDVVRPAATRSSKTAKKNRKVIVGRYTLDPGDDWRSGARGTTILSTDLVPTFRHAFKSTYSAISEGVPTLRSKNPGRAIHRGRLPTTWDEFLRRAATVSTVHELGDYWRWLWDLGALCPVPYDNASAMPDRMVAAAHRRLVSYRFRLIVDGISVYKPAFLGGDNEGGYTCVPIPRTTTMVMKRPLTYSGYVVVQEGKQVSPAELRGVLVRVGEIGVGLYDPSFLDYRFNEGPRSRWLTSELFVEEGLEDVLNVDRDSFNRYAPEFQVLQRNFHELLRGEVFPAVYSEIEKRTRKAQARREKKRVVGLRELVEEAFDDRDVQVVVSPADRKATLPDGVQVLITDRKITIRISSAGLTGTKRSMGPIGATVLSIYDLASSEKDPASRRRRFVALLRDVLRKW